MTCHYGNIDTVLVTDLRLVWVFLGAGGWVVGQTYGSYGCLGVEVLCRRATVGCEVDRRVEDQGNSVRVGK